MAKEIIKTKKNGLAQNAQDLIKFSNSNITTCDNEMQDAFSKVLNFLPRQKEGKAAQI